MDSNYESLMIEAEEQKLIVKEKPLLSFDGRIKGKKIAIRQDIRTATEKSCVLAEELGHYYTSTGDIIDMDDVSNRKQEYRARLWAYDKKIGLLGLVKAYQNGCRQKHEISCFLDVTEDFLEEALRCYQSKYGQYKAVDQYLIFFQPYLHIGEMI